MKGEIEMRVALCDDNTDWLATEEEYISCIRDRSLRYDAFASGEALIEAYKQNGCIYDAIFLDMEMNRLDGINTANMIRSMDKSVLIIFVTSHKKYMQKSFEYHHALALSNDGTAYGWGNAANGALGEIGQDACYSPVTIDIDDVEKVIAGMDNSFFIKNDKTVYACGNNDYGQLGDGTLNSRKSISAVGITDVSDISAGFSTLFLKTDGSAYGCGLNAFGELGIGNTTANVRNITKIPGSYDEVSTGGHHSLFLGKDKYIYAAGRNHRKQCGTSDTAKNYLSPTEILAFEDDLLIYDYLSQEKELNITSGNLYVFAVTVGNMIDIQNKIFTVSYDNTKLDVDDLCAQTWKKDTSIGNVADTDITILSKTDSQVQFKVNNAKSTSGTVNLIRFKAISTGTASITVEVK